ncbi:phosphate ABC transporter substrate-binding protein PstS family protein [Vagococcus elongatus]|uniref:Phosphate-binding protein n=1 Tax=Vagococcus elongatus TaxID=180344 RepID=A0A430B5R5_9ENTE|nr:phosphate ABC transporter substrate-binding protein PstS family protein [Vagococcus elongatus]RSU15653.1 phosphate ABC transporter substrate-binding protein [Vagococcus elongatus]
MKKIGIAGLLAAVLLITGACGGGETAESGSGSSDKSQGNDNKKVEITAVGSTALQPLVEQIAEIYMTDHPNYSIVVQGGGSGTGLTQVSTGAVDIGNSDVFAEEKEGIDSSAIKDHQVAVVGMGPVVNKDVGVDDVSHDELIDIFTGKIKNWKELGGKDQEIVVVNRAQGSGTRATFEKWGLNDAQSVASQEQDSSGTVKKIVAETPGAISYLVFSYFDDSLNPLKIDGVEPTEENVATNDWKIWSYEHMYTEKDASSDITAFLDYIMTEDVQKNVVAELNYIPITSMKISRDLEGNVETVK